MLFGSHFSASEIASLAYKKYWTLLAFGIKSIDVHVSVFAHVFLYCIKLPCLVAANNKNRKLGFSAVWPGSDPAHPPCKNLMNSCTTAEPHNSFLPEQQKW